ncbi:NnrU family protein [Chelatococcus reniformis]|uniref:NnrU domain-containing protein n=1 Tax=Chelatococcus reniformis TaxID=1494448 RepID=A0A916UIL4_9HYPH|nr:NnrU family protein [Chelatococcus reniformis]GGC74362.1 hypothetical protein GCM10010994_35990 [Chelatococcus reniformis]
MPILVLGLVLFFAAHIFTMLRAPRARFVGLLGEGPYKLAYSVVSALGLILIVLGFGAYRETGYIQVWDPPVWTRHLALLLNLPVFILLVAAYAPGFIKLRVKHPMLLAVKIWATAHLLANGDLGSILLFSSFLAWAVSARIAVKRRGDQGLPARPASWKADVVAVAGGLVAYALVIGYLHPLLIGVPVLS